jgi:hypothetical protein
MKRSTLGFNGRRRLLRNTLWLAVGLCAASLAVSASTPIDEGYEDHGYPGSTGDNGEVTAEKPESKLWYNDGSWWGSLWSNASSAYTIHRLDTGTQSWIDTGTELDPRQSSKADTLWDGQKLYVVSHRWDGVGQSASSGNRGELFRYSYASGSQTYSLDAGFPVEVTEGLGEALVMAKDSTGTLWVTYVENQQVRVNHSLSGNDASWGSSFVLPTSHAGSVTDDDMPSIAAYDGRVGVLFSDQSTGKFYFAVHVDGQGDGVWTEVSPYGASTDDHMNIKVLSGDPAGRVFIAAKTSSSSALILLLVCENTPTYCASAGDWTAHTVYNGTVSPSAPPDPSSRSIPRTASSTSSPGTRRTRAAAARPGASSIRRPTSTISRSAPPVSERRSFAGSRSALTMRRRPRAP